jgi:trans-aconitate methyltransferase
MTDELLAEQIQYYRERAPEYDATSPQGAPFRDTLARIAAELRALGPVGSAIELGAGTGLWTQVLAGMAETVTAVDASPETLAILRDKVSAPSVTTVAADVFDWRPDAPADLVVFGALLSHIPSDRFEAFWSIVDRALRPGGRVFVIDEAAHQMWDEAWASEDEVVVRTLEDGRRFRIVKVLWDPAALATRLGDIGWDASFTREDPFFWGVVTRC